MSVEIESADVVRLILQYLKENNLMKSMDTLQNETGIELNSVDSMEAFTNDVMKGHWDTVLKVVSTIKVADKKLQDLYEQIIIDPR